MDLLRFFTAGNVDDGKSTLIGRLLLDSNSVSTDIIEILTKQSKNSHSNLSLDLALLTDGLRAEREQGITIDVAYKFFSSETRKYIIADTPGHVEYTRNMFTGASTCDLALILIDARHGVTEQTKRHTLIASILGISNLVVCINKMDLVAYKEEVFQTIKLDFEKFNKSVNGRSVYFIPLSALLGKNVVNRCTDMDWYKGQTLFDYLENIRIEGSESNNPSRFQVQYVIRPQIDKLHDYRGYAGSILSGKFSIDDEVSIYPSEHKSKIVRIEKHNKNVSTAEEGDPVVFHLEDSYDIGRGATFAKYSEIPKYSDTMEAIICWMDNKPFTKGQRLFIQHNSNLVRTTITEIVSSIDIHSAKELTPNESIVLNEICKIVLKVSHEIAYDSFLSNRKNGSFILINENSNNTVAAGIFS